jgi:acyl dehydratase
MVESKKINSLRPFLLTQLVKVFCSRKPTYIDTFRLPDICYEGSYRIDPLLLMRYQELLNTQDIPLLYPQLASSPLLYAILLDPQFPVRLPGIIHMGHMIRSVQKLKLDEPYQVSCRFGTSTASALGFEFEVWIRWEDGNHDLVWESCGRFLLRKPSAKRQRSAKKHDQTADLNGYEQQGSWQLRKDLGRRYAAISGDYNPIHLSPWTSRWFGFAQPIAHGLYSLAQLCSDLNLQLHQPLEIRAKFLAPLFLPSTAEVYTKISDDGSTDARVTTFGKGRLCLELAAKPSASSTST